jgi:hypothetical protein
LRRVLVSWLHSCCPQGIVFAWQRCVSVLFFDSRCSMITKRISIPGSTDKIPTGQLPRRAETTRPQVGWSTDANAPLSGPRKMHTLRLQGSNDILVLAADAWMSAHLATLYLCHSSERSRMLANSDAYIVRNCQIYLSVMPIVFDGGRSRGSFWYS